MSKIITAAQAAALEGWLYADHHGLQRVRLPRRT